MKPMASEPEIKTAAELTLILRLMRLRKLFIKLLVTKSHYKTLVIKWERFLKEKSVGKFSFEDLKVLPRAVNANP